MALRKIDLMHRQFGKCEGHTCRECSNLVKGKYRSKNLIKCKVYGLSHSEASDWAKRWQACGMFNEQWSGKPVMRLIRPSRQEKEEMQSAPIEGQLRMEV